MVATSMRTRLARLLRAVAQRLAPTPGRLGGVTSTARGVASAFDLNGTTTYKYLRTQMPDGPAGRIHTVTNLDDDIEELIRAIKSRNRRKGVPSAGI